MPCDHQLELSNSWLSGPKIVCRRCGRKWPVRGKLLADTCCWALAILISVLCPVFFGRAMQAIASYGFGSGLVGLLMIGMIVGPFILATHFMVFALGHVVHGALIRKSGKLEPWMVEDPYHRDA